MNRIAGCILVLILVQFVFAEVPYEKVQSLLRMKCREHCLLKVKVEKFCPNFCEFVKHIIDEHGPKVYEDFNRSKSPEKALDWAMSSVVEWKMRTKIEDHHEAAEMFHEYFAKWSKELSHRDEL